MYLHITAASQRLALAPENVRIETAESPRPVYCCEAHTATTLVRRLLDARHEEPARLARRREACASGDAARDPRPRWQRTQSRGRRRGEESGEYLWRDARLHEMSASQPRQRRDSSPRHVRRLRLVSAECPRRSRGGAAPRLVSTECLRRSRGGGLVSTEYPRRGRGGDLSPRNVYVAAAAADSSPRNIHVAAAAAPRLVSTECLRGSRSVAATPLRNFCAAKYALVLGRRERARRVDERATGL